MDCSKIESTVADKKLDHYASSGDCNNYVIPTEITVTITLNEYRSLLTSHATRQQAIDKANEDRYTREAEIKAVKEENARLKGENYDLKTLVDELKDKLAREELPDA